MVSFHKLDSSIIFPGCVCVCIYTHTQITVIFIVQGMERCRNRLFFSLSFLHHLRSWNDQGGAPRDSGRKEEHQPWMLHPSRKEGASDRPAEPEKASRGARKGSRWAETVLIPVAKKNTHTCHEFYLNNTGVQHGRSKSVINRRRMQTQ